MGRKPFKPTEENRKQVEAMSGFGIPAADIARVFGTTDVTLRKYFREEIDTGTTKANSQVAQSLFKKAIGDGPSATTAAIFWLKTRARWRETPQEHEIMLANVDVTHEDRAKALAMLLAKRQQADE